MSEESNNEWENEGGSVLSSKMEPTAITSSIGYDQAAFLVKDSTSNKTSIVDEIVTNRYLSLKNFTFE
jgi:fumarate hydratase class II